MAHEFTCDDCGFSVRSPDDDEVIRIVRRHARERHEMDLSKRDVRDGWHRADE